MSLWLALFAGIGLGASLLPARAADVPLSEPIPSTVYEIELTYIGERTDPTVAFSGPPPTAAPLPYRPFLPILELRASLGAVRPFGPCRGQVTKLNASLEVQWSAAGAARCGQRIELHPAGKPVDLLSYRMLRLRGRATGSVVVGIEDLAGYRREDNWTVSTLSGSFDLTVSLQEISRGVDLRQVTALVVSAEGQGGQIQLEKIEVTQETPVMKRQAGTGFWVWNYRQAVKDPEAMLSTCRAQGCSRLLIQVPAQSDDEGLWREYAQLMAKVRDAGIEPWVLDGYPEAIQEPQRLADKIWRLLHLVPLGLLSGVQLDLEPYLVSGFLQDEAQLRRYLGTIEMVKDAIQGRARLSMVIPFWLAAPTVSGRPLAFAVMDLADEVAVMSYRTDLDEIQDIADDILRYGSVSGIPVWLAVETTVLPVEQHVVLRRAPQSGQADALLDRDHRLLRWRPIGEADSTGLHREWFRVHRRFTVNPERLSFAGRSRAQVSSAIKTIRDTTSHSSFSGVMIHDLDGFRALAE
ncbi:hypothetical protein [Nitrospira defluvii]|uniref:Uncharacterized protein n=1 Tax=Nitrospira defluvii TaxID=330214 RepID=A0ABM8QRZ5_9BACT|nr:hypothetical protein [Nitrospira defluvii]CAE6712206.1 conserved exported hypothetical protein [Nitrospira defluvii]